MIHDIDLRALAELEGAERAFLSLYISGPDALGSLADRERKVAAFLAEDEVEREHFEANMKLVRRWLDEHAAPESARVIFASWALDFVRGYDVDLALPDLLRVDHAPFIRPLAELQDEYETFAVVAADNHATRIFAVTGERTEDEERVSGGVKNRVKVGGWSQKRYARRRENELMHYADDIAERLGAMHGERAFSRIVLLGSQETCAAINAALPQALADLVVATDTADLTSERDALIDQAYEHFFADERASEETLWQRIRDAYLAHGLGASGATDVLAAVKVGRADAIVLIRDAEIAGTRCRACENVVHGTPETCQICGSKDVFKVDLVNEITLFAERTSARVDYADPIDGLAKAGAVAALLRY